MNECFEGFLFMGDQPYDLNLSREVNATAKLNFNKVKTNIDYILNFK